MPGPTRKPPERRQRRNTRQIGLVAIGDRVGQGPPAPSGLLKGTSDAWVAFWTSPLARLVSTESDLPALVRLFRLQDERERAYRGLQGERLVLGSKGQPRLNPLYGAIATLDAEIRALEDRFGLSPAARLRLGVTLGDAHRSLASLNADLGEDDDDELDEDPRLALVEGGAAAV